MKRSEAARYARWSAMVTIALAALTGGIYLHRQWTAHVEKKNAPPAPPQDVERQSSLLTFSKVEGEHVIFTVQASKSTDFKGQDISLLEDVKITVFGKAGDRNDVIHTQSCKYAKADGAIQCTGTVLMELQSSADAQRAQKESERAPGLVRVETSGVTFERATGRAETAQRVKFSFPNGNGEGLGAVYFSEEGRLRLTRDVRLRIEASETTKAKTGKEPPVSAVDVSGTSMELGKTSRTLLLYGPVVAATTAQKLTAGELTVALDPQFRAQTLVATSGGRSELPEISSQSAKGDSTLRAEKLSANLAPQGWITSLVAEGSVQGNSPNGTLQAERGELEMWPRINQARLLTLHGNVHAQGHDPKSGTTRSLQTNALQMMFSGGAPGEGSRVQRAEALERGTMEWTDAAGARSKLAADKLALEFGASRKAQRLVATGAVKTERELKGRPLQTASAADGTVDLEPAGGWSQMVLHGNVRLKEGERSGEAQRAVFSRTQQTAELTGGAAARDASSETRADRIAFHQGSGEVEANGNVRSTDLSKSGSGVTLSPEPAKISADRMTGNSKSGRALYSGHARLWQGASVLEADTIELLREGRMLNATGNVRAVFPRTSAAGAAKVPAIWHVSSDTLTYYDMENRAHLERHVLAQSAEERMRSTALDLYFSRETGGGPGRGGASQISRAVGTGGVVVEQGDRRGTAEHGVYTAADQTFVLSGGNPTLFDAIEGTTTGRELTFHLADDTIIVDSGNGLRTLTRHRVQK